MSADEAAVERVAQMIADGLWQREGAPIYELHRRVARIALAVAAPAPGDAALIAELRDKLQIALSFAEHPEFKTVYDAQQMEVPRDVWIDATTRWLDGGPPASRRAQGAGA